VASVKSELSRWIRILLGIERHSTFVPKIWTMGEAGMSSGPFKMSFESKLLSASSLPSLPDEDFCQGMQFSPDSLCVLTSRCNRLLLFNTTTTNTQCWRPALQCQTGDSVRSYLWYPHMRSNDPSSCCFAGVSR
jgi:hypothetical protein